MAFLIVASYHDWSGQCFAGTKSTLFVLTLESDDLIAVAAQVVVACSLTNIKKIYLKIWIKIFLDAS